MFDVRLARDLQSQCKTDCYVKLYLLQTQVLNVEQVNEPYIGLIQENLIENSVQDSLPYIY